jgi:hypothetical protein
MLEKPLIPDFDATCQKIHFYIELNDFSQNKKVITAQKNYETSIQTQVNKDPSDLALLEAKRRFAVFEDTRKLEILAITQKEFYQCVHKVQMKATSNLNSNPAEDTQSKSELVFASIVNIFLIIYFFSLLYNSLQINGIFNILNIILLIFLITAGLLLRVGIRALFASPVKATAAPNEQDLLIEEIAKLLEQKYQF